MMTAADQVVQLRLNSTMAIIHLPLIYLKGLTEITEFRQMSGLPGKNIKTV